MLFLLLCILSSTAVFILFKFIGSFKINTFSAIIVNYITACSAGFFLSNSNHISTSILEFSWFPLSVLIGLLFISVFWLIGKSTQNAGVAVTSVAGKMSVIIPISFSIWLDPHDSLTSLKAIAILLALTAVLLTAYRHDAKGIERRRILLPLAIFLGIGIIDSLVKYAQTTYISDAVNPLFSAVTFGIAGSIGLLLLTVNHGAAQGILCIKTWGLGILLGLANFGSVYFMIGALNHIDTDTGKTTEGSVVFGINNISIVVLSLLLGYILFHERPTKLNWAGIALSLFTIILLTYS